MIGEEIARQLETSDSPYTILSSPLLLETGQKDLCNKVVVVDVPEQVQIERTMQRDANDEDQIRRIMAAQLQRQQRLELADEVLDNSGSPAQLQAEVERLHQRFMDSISA